MSKGKGIPFVEAVFSSLAGAGPLLNVAILISYAYIYAGNYMFLSFIISFILFIFFMNTTYQLSKNKVGRGAYYIFIKDNKYLKNFISIYFLYVLSSFSSILIFLVFILVPFLLNNNHLWVFEYAIFFALLFLIFIIIRLGIRPSVRYSSAGAILEVSFIVALTTILLLQSRFPPKTFWTGFNLNGIFIGSLFSVLVFAGLGSPVSFGDEIEKPLINVKKSLATSTIVEGIIFIFASFFISLFLSENNIPNAQSPVPIWWIVNYLGLPLLLIFTALLMNSFFNILTLYGISLSKTFYSASEVKMDEEKYLIISLSIITILTAFLLYFFGAENAFLLATSMVTFNWIIFHDVLNFSLISEFLKDKNGALRKLLFPSLAIIFSIIIGYYILSSLSYPFYLAPFSSIIMIIIYSILKIILKSSNNIKNKSTRRKVY